MARRPTKEERELAQKIVAPYRKQINDTPLLLSVLYDIDLIPEQIMLPVNGIRCAAFCEVFKNLSPEAIAELSKPTE